MTLQEILNDPGKLGQAAREFVEQAAAFIEALAENDLTLEFGPADGTENKVDYDAPVSAAYVKSYKPIAASEIVSANKEMSEALAGENKVAGFVAAIKLFALASAL